jgi:initiation factor 1A
MSKVNRGGSRHKKQKKIGNTGGKREFIVKEEENEHYGVVLAALGNCRFSILCDDETTRVCKLGNTLKKQYDIHVGLLVLISLVSDADEKGYIIHAFIGKEVKKLYKMGNLNYPFLLEKMSVHISTSEGGIEFGEDGETRMGYVNGELVEISSSEEEDDKKDDDFDIDDI